MHFKIVMHWIHLGLKFAGTGKNNYGKLFFFCLCSFVQVGFTLSLLCNIYKENKMTTPIQNWIMIIYLQAHSNFDSLTGKSIIRIKINPSSFLGTRVVYLKCLILVKKDTLFAFKTIIYVSVFFFVKRPQSQRKRPCYISEF